MSQSTPQPILADAAIKRSQIHQQTKRGFDAIFPIEEGGYLIDVSNVSNS